MVLNKTALFTFLILLTVALAWSFPGRAQSSSDTSSRLDRMERDIQTLSRAIYRGEEPPPGAFSGGGGSADTEVRLQQLETQIRDLTGRVEEQSYQIRQLQEAMERQAGDLELRLQDLERGGMAAAPSRYTPPQPQNSAPVYNQRPAQQQPVQQLGSYTQSPVSDNVTGAVDDAAAAYENAFAMLKAGNYDSAEVEFKNFLDRYPDHVLGPNAKYWYGETFYVRGEHERAARIFADAYQSDPQGSKSADNLLKLGMSLAGMGNQSDACIALRQLTQGGAQAGSPVMRRAEQEMARLGC